MGYVVAARHLQLGQMVALKFMRDEICTPEYKSRFLREARNTVRLKSKHVSRVLDVGALDGGTPYMVMEYLEGRDLSDLLHKGGPVPVQEACEYILQACEAIAEAHGHGIVHRDLKPANLFLTKGQSGEPIVKVLDFGVSKVLDLGTEEETNPGGRPRKEERADSVVTKITDLLGSPSYMAPEQIMSARDADARSDVWSLGVILFRLISGKAPFHAQSLGELIQQIMHGPIPSLRDAKPDIPAGLEHVVGRCLERERANRLGEVVELARLLAPYAGPVASPSLERIAILGPALVSRPSVPAPSPSGPSFNSHNSNANAWTAPPMRGSTSSQPEKRDITPASAAIWALVFVVFVGITAVMVARVAAKHEVPIPAATTASTVPTDPAGSSGNTAAATSAAASMASGALPNGDPSTPGSSGAVATGSAAGGALPVPSSKTAAARVALPAGGGGGAHGGRQARPAGGARPGVDPAVKPAAAAVTATAEIPATRE